MFLLLSDSSDKMQGLTHLGIRVVIYQGGSSGWHPKGARSAKR